MPIAERFVESAKSECLDRMVLLGEAHFRQPYEFVHHCHEERSHLGLGNELIAPKTTVIGTGQMKCRERRPAQVLLPRGRVAAWVQFSHRTKQPIAGATPSLTVRFTRRRRYSGRRRPSEICRSGPSTDWRAYATRRGG